MTGVPARSATRGVRLLRLPLSGLPSLAAVLVTATLAACAPWGALPADESARIWDVQARRFVTQPELVARLAPVRYRLLGEVHDNAEHHVIRAQLIRALAATGKGPAVVMEQFDLEHETALRTAQVAGADAEALATAGAFDRKAWAWPLHKPVLEAAVAARLPVHAANVPRAALQEAMRRGKDAKLDAAWLARMQGAEWSDAQARELDEEIVESHCRKLPPAMVPQLAFAQRVRDAAMADALVTNATADGAIFIAGNGHVRRNLGVPAYLDNAGREASVAVGLVEAGPTGRLSHADAEDLAREHPEYDYVWLTSRTERPDPCAAFAIRPSRAAGAAAPSTSTP